MKESEASPGTKLHALVIACQVRTTMTTQLRKMTEQSGPEWDKLMRRLQANLVNAVHERRQEGRTT